MGLVWFLYMSVDSWESIQHYFSQLRLVASYSEMPLCSSVGWIHFEAAALGVRRIGLRFIAGFATRLLSAESVSFTGWFGSIGIWLFFGFADFSKANSEDYWEFLCLRPCLHPRWEKYQEAIKAASCRDRSQSPRRSLSNQLPLNAHTLVSWFHLYFHHTKTIIN